MAIYCINCGKELPDDAVFCLKCGKQQNSGLQRPEPRWEVCEIKVKERFSAVLAWNYQFLAEAVGPRACTLLVFQEASGQLAVWEKTKRGIAYSSL